MSYQPRILEVSVSKDGALNCGSSGELVDDFALSTVGTIRSAGGVFVVDALNCYVAAFATDTKCDGGEFPCGTVLLTLEQMQQLLKQDSRSGDEVAILDAVVQQLSQLPALNGPPSSSLILDWV